MGITRRDALKLGVVGGAFAGVPLLRYRTRSEPDRLAESRIPRPYMLPFAMPPVIDLVAGPDGVARHRVEMRMVTAEIVPGLATRLFAYDGAVPGPTFRVRRGTPAKIRFANALPQAHPTLGYRPSTSVHLHGSASLPQFDGYASDVTSPGEYKDYRYPNYQPSRTLWYHDHAVHRTGENVYMGLAGQYHMFDARERALPLPKGAYDVPLTIGDAMFDPSGDLRHEPDYRVGQFGDVILVNGVPWPRMRVARRKYRFRVLIGTPARSFNLRLSDGSPMTVIGTDGGLMPVPQTVTSMRAISGERYEIVIDFSRYSPGALIELRNRSPLNNEDFANTNKIMAFEVSDDPFDSANNEVPAQLFADNPVMTHRAVDAVARRRIRVKRDGETWTINGHTWDTVIDSGFTFAEARPRYGDLEIWELENSSGGWHHPVHLHLVDFRVLDRNGRTPFAYERGPKDVVYVGENEIVRVLVRFEGQVGKYMVHCHFLAHEDHDMMTQFEVIDRDRVADEPFAAPPRSLNDEAADPL